MNPNPKRPKETIVLPLDLASNVTGYAVLIAEGERLLEMGRLIGKPEKADIDTRTKSLQRDVAELVRDVLPAVILCELPLTRQYVKKKKPVKKGDKTGDRLSSLAMWGAAAGRITGWLEHLCAEMDNGPQVIAISNTLWTKGKSKENRQIEVCAQFPDYKEKMATDKGLDMSDAIAMALWWIRRRNDAVLTAGRAAK